MHKQIALMIIVMALLFLIFLSPAQLGATFLVIGVLVYAFGAKVEGERGG